MISFQLQVFNRSHVIYIYIYRPLGAADDSYRWHSADRWLSCSSPYEWEQKQNLSLFTTLFTTYHLAVRFPSQQGFSSGSRFLRSFFYDTEVVNPREVKWLSVWRSFPQPHELGQQIVGKLKHEIILQEVSHVSELITFSPSFLICQRKRHERHFGEYVSYKCLHKKSLIKVCFIG